jgi:hypothetical protein
MVRLAIAVGVLLNTNRFVCLGGGFFDKPDKGRPVNRQIDRPAFVGHSAAALQDSDIPKTAQTSLKGAILSNACAMSSKYRNFAL